MPANFDDLNKNDSSALSVNGATPDAKLANSDRPAPPKLRRRDDSDIQRIDAQRESNDGRAKDFITENRLVRVNVEALLESEARATAQVIADAPYRLQELIAEYTGDIQAQHGNYADLKRQNETIRNLWK